jgi:hypothetical protein
MTAIEFIKNDKGYNNWLKNHEDGFVINTRSNKPSSYMILHKASCYKIKYLCYKHNARYGGFTHRAYIKICGENIADLQIWVKNHGRTNGTFSAKCGLCKPNQSVI